MLTKIFGSNSFASLFILIIITAVLWSRMFFADSLFVGYIPVSPLYNLLVTHMESWTIIVTFLAFGFIFLQALLLNNLLAENDILPKKSYMAAYMIVLFTSSFSNIVLFHPILLSGLLLTIALLYLLKLYDSREGYTAVFNTSMLISLASMIYFPSVVFILFVWVCFIIYRLFAWREWFISILGLILPYLFLGTYYYWNDRLLLKMDEYLLAFSMINFYDFNPSIPFYIFSGFTALLLLLAIFRLLGMIGEKAIRLRKMLAIMIWFFLISFLSLVISPNYNILGFVLLLLPTSVLISIYITNNRIKWHAEVMLILILIIVVFLRLGLFENMNQFF